MRSHSSITSATKYGFKFQLIFLFVKKWIFGKIQFAWHYIWFNCCLNSLNAVRKKLADRKLIPRTNVVGIARDQAGLRSGNSHPIQIIQAFVHEETTNSLVKHVNLKSSGLRTLTILFKIQIIFINGIKCKCVMQKKLPAKRSMKIFSFVDPLNQLPYYSCTQDGNQRNCYIRFHDWKTIGN